MVKKLLNASNIIACLTCVLALVMVILYAINVNVNGYFQGVKAQYVVLMCILTMVADVLIIGSSLLKLEGAPGLCLRVCVTALKIAVPVFMMVAALSLLQARIEGIGYIYGSNVDVAKEVATPANLASAGVAITAIAFGLVTSIAGMVGAFFQPKEEKPAEEPAQQA